jgi:hypothetical protein
MRDLTEEDTDLGELIDMDEWIGMCVDGEIGDEDGYAYLVYDEDQVDDKKEWAPSFCLTEKIPETATHALWYTV